MGYQDDYFNLSQVYHPNNNSIISDDDIQIINAKFKSTCVNNIDATNIHCSEIRDILLQDMAIEANRNFTYPIILNKEQVDYSEVIILFHGLNERSWKKYLPWGKALCVKKNCPVILFPISFHMNRSPLQWSNPRKMMPLAKTRKAQNQDLREGSVVNAAISNRLNEHPERFLISGLETYYDVLHLADLLSKGMHPILNQINTVHFFGYSIGALLAQILMMTHGEDRFFNSKAFLFCGGTTLDKMQGASRFILDSAAFEALKKCYVSNSFALKTEDFPYKTPYKSEVQMVFSSMMNSVANNKFRNSTLKKLQGKVLVCALEKDDVIPAKAVKETFNAAIEDLNNVVESIDFPFNYSHVTPFPYSGNQLEVDKAFELVFDKAAGFLK
jgi:pimeloyl-ACP methyl ester carboxylesterase